MQCKGNCFFSFNQNMVKNLYESDFCSIFAELKINYFNVNRKYILTYEPKKSLSLR